MKFAESLSEGLVPEWKDQYVDYREGKKQIHRATETFSALNEQKTSDTTPLLDPLDDSQHYVPDFPEQNLDSQPEQESRRRPSIFNFSTKTSKDKKEEFLVEKAQFKAWIENELAKVDGFFKDRERDVYERFLILEDQFYQLKDHRLEASKPEKKDSGRVAKVEDGLTLRFRKAMQILTKYELPTLPSTVFMEKWRSHEKLDDVTMKTRQKRESDEFDPNFRENQVRNGHLEYLDPEFDDDLLTYSMEQTSENERNVQVPQQTPAQLRTTNRRDYVPKKAFGVPYLYAKKQLKEALVEHYRSISLIKSYRVMNRTAFRKITKKFDKAVHTSLSPEFMRKVDKESYFQTSLVLEKILSRVEDLFLTFFDTEKMDRKHGLEKLRSATYAYNNADIRHPRFYKSTFFSGLLLGVGLPLFAIAVYRAIDKTLVGEFTESRYLLQVWAGFFLMNFALLLIGINLIVYTQFKISYKFIFEFNMANALDYKQYFLLPSLGFALLSLMSWLSFLDFWPNVFPGRDWPIIYLGVVLVVFLWPGTQFHAASRRWLQIALWRIFCSGLYPVEFRDFFLGDIFCSLTYSMGNLSFFFCLYAVEWKGILGGGDAPASESRCGSSHSRAMGFFAALPSIWRFLQCVRRYMDTGDEFPHLANMVKYLIGAIYYCLLSLWRIDHLEYHRVLFITFATINSVYCSAWDIVMDWSLGQTTSKHYLLRDHLFFGRALYYYAAIIVDVILRFQWVFYACFSNQIQQLAVTSFCVALAEILRRFIWMFFRMENEHSTNVILFRASRDSPLPYLISLKVERAIQKLVEMKYNLNKDDDLTATDSSDPSVGKTTAYSGVVSSLNKNAGDDEASLAVTNAPQPSLTRRKSTFITFSDALKKAHIKDFQRKKYAVQLDSDEEDDEDNDDELKRSTSKKRTLARDA